MAWESPAGRGTKCQADGRFVMHFTVAAKRLLERRLDDHFAYHALAPLYVVTTNLGAYHQLCPTIVSTFSNTTDMFVADRMAKDCLMLPSAGVDLNAVAAMAKLAVT